MTQDIEFVEAAGAPSPIAQALRKKIGWLCHLIRVLAIVWNATTLYNIYIYCNRETWLANFGKYVGADLSGVSQDRYLAALSFQLATWIATVGVTYATWRLFALYLQGRVFTQDASIWLRRIGSVGGVAIAISVIASPAIDRLFTAGVAVQRHVSWGIASNQLLDIIFVTFLFSLAYIFKTAAELADEHAQIV